MCKRTTAAQIAQKIRANCNLYHERKIDHEAFSAEQNRLWRYAESRSSRFLDIVSRSIMLGAAA
jgi:hypothetical protein